MTSTRRDICFNLNLASVLSLCCLRVRLLQQLALAWRTLSVSRPRTTCLPSALPASWMPSSRLLLRISHTASAGETWATSTTFHAAPCRCLQATASPRPQLAQDGCFQIVRRPVHCPGARVLTLFSRSRRATRPLPPSYQLEAPRDARRQQNLCSLIDCVHQFSERTESCRARISVSSTPARFCPPATAK
ncbi:hypothetical protein EXIGLDRAFT_279181 [Exidia glandulosa HHB12029]|uniref:Uncharacterized protein n=1 Tax=Exidia glandulosa HHB12029 TaxID=1314781 RepID=A0A165DK13_EXIGL|nr:hypothetical protein EXIGLDRAFT_279181 [Exidia glandulosa HHB12029]